MSHCRQREKIDLVTDVKADTESGPSVVVPVTLINKDIFPHFRGFFFLLVINKLAKLSRCVRRVHFKNYNLKKYTLKKYTLGKYTLRKYTVERVLWKNILWKSQNLKAVGHTCQKIYAIRWSMNAL